MVHFPGVVLPDRRSRNSRLALARFSEVPVADIRKYTQFRLEELSHFPQTLGKNLIFKPVSSQCLRIFVFFGVRFSELVCFPAGPGGHQGVRKNRAKILAKSRQNPANGGPIGGKHLFCGPGLLDF